jgi:hypothetical protein
VAVARPDHAGRTQTGDQRIHAGEGSCAIKASDGVGDQGESSCCEQRARDGREDQLLLRKDDQHSDRELEGAVGWQVECTRAVGRERRLRYADRKACNPQNEQRQRATEQSASEQDKRGPQEIELLSTASDQKCSSGLGLAELAK